MKEKITTSVEEEWKLLKEKNGWTWTELIGLGIKAKQDNPQLITRIKTLETSVPSLSNRLSRIENYLNDKKYN